MNRKFCSHAARCTKKSFPVPIQLTRILYICTSKTIDIFLSSYSNRDWCSTHLIDIVSCSFCRFSINSRRTCVPHSSHNIAKIPCAIGTAIRHVLVDVRFCLLIGVEAHQFSVSVGHYKCDWLCCGRCARVIQVVVVLMFALQHYPARVNEIIIFFS